MKKSQCVTTGVIALLMASPGTFAEEYEWNPREGLHEEEWYDPGDWFDYDTPGVDYDYDWWNYPYYGYDYDTYYDPYDYDYDYDDDFYEPYTYDYDYDNYFDDYGYETYGFSDDYTWDRNSLSNQDQNRSQAQRQSKGQGGQPQKMAKGSKTLQGEIQNMRTFQTQSGQREIMATIENNQGERRKVLLGPVNQVRDFDVDEGDRIQVSGVVTTINGQRVLVANRFKLDQMQNWTRIQPSVRPAKWYKGQIQNARTVRFRGLDQQHKVAQVRLDDGKVVPVNLGPAGELPNQAIQQGEQITVAARVGKINNQPALIAERLRLDSGRTVIIDRSQEKEHFQKKTDQGGQGQASAQQRR
jgi:hypothetical protein